MSAMIQKTTSKPIKRVGYAAMGLEGFYGGIEDDKSVDALKHALDRELMIDRADAYGGGHNKQLIAKAITGRLDETFIATKFGIVLDENEKGNSLETGWGFSLNINGTPDYMNRALNNSLLRLGTDYIDLYYAHYADPGTPIEETVHGMSRAVDAGKVRYLDLSNVTADQVRRAHAIHPIAAVQYEYSLWRREAETELLPTLRELGIALVAWAPLGAGFLAGKTENLAEGDFRNNNPRFSGENGAANRDKFAPLKDIAQELGITPAQLAIAWLLHQGDDIYVIPGSRKTSRIDENAAAESVSLSSDILVRIEQLMPAGSAQGATLV